MQDRAIHLLIVMLLLMSCFQNGPPRLSDCQPTEGGAGPSPAPPAAPSPRLPPQPVGGSPLSTFHSSMPTSTSSSTSSSSPHSHSLNPPSAPVIRSAVHGFMPHTIPYSASPTTCQPSAPSLSVSGQLPISYTTPPFYSGGPRPLSTDADSKASVVDVQKQPQPSQHSYKLPPPPPPTFPPMSAPSVSFAAGLGAPPVLTTSSFPFFPPVSMMNRSAPSNSSTSSGLPCFVAPSPPSTKPLLPVNAFGEQTFNFSRPSMSAPSSTPSSAAPLPRLAMTETSPSSSRPVNLVVSNSQSRESSSSSNTSSNRPVNLPFQPHPSSRRSPSLPPSSTPSSAFPTPGNHLYRHSFINSLSGSNRIQSGVMISRSTFMPNMFVLYVCLFVFYVIYLFIFLIFNFITALTRLFNWLDISVII